MRFIVLAAALLVGCASTGWRNPSISDPRAEARQLKIDLAECEGYAASGAAPPPGPQVVVVGDHRPATGFSAGFERGAAGGAALRQAGLQRRLTAACMYRRGWEEG